MSFYAQILADSVSPAGVRLTTFEVEYPHAIHKDLLTHRAWSRNFKSFRAFPPEKVIENIASDPFIPKTFDARVQGMAQGMALAAQELPRNLWLDHIDHSIATADQMIGFDLAKAQVNFVLQDLTWIRGIITATEWGNFWALRADADNVRPEVKEIACMMKAAYEDSEPRTLDYHDWHLPLVSLDFPYDQEPDWEYWRKVSIGRCARVSYLTHDGIRDPAADVALHDKLLADRHLSPFEHVARPFSRAEWRAVRAIQAAIHLQSALPQDARERWADQAEFEGNFRGWHQARKDLLYEHDLSLAVAA